MRHSLLVIATGITILVAVPQIGGAQNVASCPNPDDCIKVGITSPSGAIPSGGGATIGLTFDQGPASAGQGGPDKVAALALTLQMGEGAATPLVLNDCNLDADGLPGAVHPDGSLSGFRVVVENASCAGGRTHCLCPDAGQTRDNFVNLVVYGPNPLPPPGTGVDITPLPSGPLLTIDLKVAPGATGTVPLHILSQATDAAPSPQPKALLSVGDKIAVDQTCSPLAVPGTPPCTAAGSVSQVAITDGAVSVTGGGCTGDCDQGGSVTVDEILTMVNIALNTVEISACQAGDQDGGGTITIDEILTAVNFALTQCSG